MTDDLLDLDAATLRSRLVAALADDGNLTEEVWRAAFEDVPRHVFVPYFYRPGPEGQRRISSDDPDQRKEWITAVYEDRALVTHLIDGNTASASSQPSVMAAMLQALEVKDGMNVLEIGTGTGYNAALLAHRLGDANVTTVDVDEEIVTAAEQRLSRAGYWPAVITADGASLRPTPGRFDRIIATCQIPRIPVDWFGDLSDNGFILAPIGAGVARIHRTTATTGSGRFLPGAAFFMPLRARGDSGIVRRPALPDTPARTTDLPVETIADNAFRFVASLAVPGITWQYDLDDAGKPVSARLWTADGSIADVRADGTVAEGGRLPPWSALENAHRFFVGHERPARDRFGLTVDQDGQRPWLDTPDNLF
ncbi:methyltransferase domain-containing protein [Streptacidiphilus sp. EB129]|uniref:methyltransferase domain-containing protein n=1 Tax=Streptacidiphilus sp. EB129 TaxID=3156262 RepID=UPI003511D6B7